MAIALLRIHFESMRVSNNDISLKNVAEKFVNLTECTDLKALN